jgi:hypothetical protein
MTKDTPVRWLRLTETFAYRAFCDYKNLVIRKEFVNILRRAEGRMTHSSQRRILISGTDGTGYVRSMTDVVSICELRKGAIAHCPIRLLVGPDGSLTPSVPLTLVSVAVPIRARSAGVEFSISPIGALSLPARRTLQIQAHAPLAGVFAIWLHGKSKHASPANPTLLPERIAVSRSEFEALLDVLYRDLARADGSTSAAESVADWIGRKACGRRPVRPAIRSRRAALAKWSALAVDVEYELAKAGHSKLSLPQLDGLPISRAVARRAVARILRHPLTRCAEELYFRRERFSAHLRDLLIVR